MVLLYHNMILRFVLFSVVDAVTRHGFPEISYLAGTAFVTCTTVALALRSGYGRSLGSAGARRD
jgi:hypothetical protein